MPIGNIELSGVIADIHKLVRKLEFYSATPGVSPVKLAQTFGKIAAAAHEGVMCAAAESIENAALDFRNRRAKQ